MEFEMFDMEKTIKGEHSEEAVELENMLSNEKVNIRKISVTAKDHVYIFYEPNAELVEQETERLASLRKISFEITKNAVYGKLTNAKQRNLYLCEFCKITKSDAEDVMELVKVFEAEKEVVTEMLEEEERQKAEAIAKYMKSATGVKIKDRAKLLEKEREEKERIHRKDVSK